MGIFPVGKTGARKYVRSAVERERHLEDFLEEHVEVLDPGIFVIGRQVKVDGNNSIDLMGMDKDGNTAIIELKRGMSPREVISQALDYAVWAEGAEYDILNDIVKKKHLVGGNSDLHALFESKFNSIPDPWNGNQTIYIVAEQIDEKTEEMAQYLHRRAVDIKCAEINFYEDAESETANVNFVVGGSV